MLSFSTIGWMRIGPQNPGPSIAKWQPDSSPSHATIIVASPVKAANGPGKPTTLGFSTAASLERAGLGMAWTHLLTRGNLA